MLRREYKFSLSLDLDLLSRMSIADDLLIEPYWLRRLLKLPLKWTYMYLHSQSLSDGKSMSDPYGMEAKEQNNRSVIRRG